MAKKEVKEMVKCPVIGHHIRIKECKKRGTKLDCFAGMSLGKVVCEYAATDDMPVGDSDE